MRISPVDIRQQQFTTKMFRGYDPDEVEAFLEDVAEDYEAVLKETALLKEQLANFDERSRGVSERERMLQETLTTTQRLTEEMKATAKREAELVVRDAGLQGEKLLEETRAEQARLRSQIQALKRLRRELTEDLKATMERFQRVLTADLESPDWSTEPDGKA